MRASDDGTSTNLREAKAYTLAGTVRKITAVDTVPVRIGRADPRPSAQKVGGAV